MSPRSSAGTDTRVLNYLERVADMDGFVTTVQREIAAAVGVSQVTASRSLIRLERSGLVKRIAPGHGRSNLYPGSHLAGEYQLLGEEWS